jgi:hypothetical protein
MVEKFEIRISELKCDNLLPTADNNLRRASSYIYAENPSCQNKIDSVSHRFTLIKMINLNALIQLTADSFTEFQRNSNAPPSDEMNKKT